MEQQLDRIAAAFEAIAKNLAKISHSIDNFYLEIPSDLNVKAFVQLENEPHTIFKIKIDDDTKVQIINETLYSGFTSAPIKQIPFKVSQVND